MIPIVVVPRDLLVFVADKKELSASEISRIKISLLEVLPKLSITDEDASIIFFTDEKRSDGDKLDEETNTWWLILYMFTNIMTVYLSMHGFNVLLQCFMSLRQKSQVENSKKKKKAYHNWLKAC